MGGGGMGGGFGGAPMACGSCGFSACGGCGMGIAPGMNACGGCGWSWGRRQQGPGLIATFAGYEASKGALEHMESSGQGDSPEAEVARAGMQASQLRLIVGGVGAVIAIIIFIVILGHLHSSSTPNGLWLSHAHVPRSVWASAGS